MDQLIAFFTRKNIVTLLILAVLAVGLLVGLRLVQQQTQLKSKAAGEFICDGTPEQNFCIQFLDDDSRTGNIVVGKAVAVIVVAKAEFGDTNVYLDGTYSTKAPGNVDVIYTGGGTNPCTGDQSYQYCWKFTIPSVTNQVYRETFKSTEAPSGRVAGTFQPQAAPSQTVTIGGRVTRSDNGAGIQGVVINQNAINPTNCNIGIDTTDSDGGYRFTVEKNKPFCLRPPQDSNHNPIAPISAVSAPASPGSYEGLTATVDNTNFDFVYPPAAPAEPVPSDQATCESITIDGQDLGSATQTVNPGSSHTIEIIMRNPPSDSKNTSKTWESGYSLKFTSGTQAANALGLNPTSVPLTAKVEPQKTFESGSSITITPPSTSSGNYNFVWQMHNGSGTPFGGQCKRQITVGSVGGPGPSPSPGAFDFDVDTGGNITVVQGSSVTQTIEVTRRDRNAGSPLVNLSASGFPSGVTHRFSGASCAPRVDSSCTRTLTIEARSDAATITSNVTVTAKFGQLERQTNFDLTVKSAVTSFNFSLSNVADITLTQGQSDPGRSITVSRTAGDAEDVTLSVIGDIGGANFAFKPSESCKPDNNNRCQRILTFDTQQAIAGEYVAEVEGRAAGGRTQVSNPFRLKINPSGGPSPSPSPSPTITPSPSPTPPPARTQCFFMDSKPITATACSDEGAQAYSTHPMVIPLTLTTAGRQTVFVRFISTEGQIRSFQRVINFAPDPKLTEVSCSHSLSGAGSVVSITGTALGPRGKGKVKLAGDDAAIITWNETDGTITASIDKRIEGKNEVEITRDDGKKARGECIVGTTSVTFTAQSQCKSAGDFSAENVSVKIFANAPTTIETEKPDPIISEKIRVDKDGKPAGFVPKLEKDKKYSLIIKAPGTLSKRVDFETKGGTRNLDAVTLPAGDIAPATSADGKINAFDRAELTRQWSLVRDVQRSGDFNQDGRINSIDYACMRQNINQSDEEFSPSVPKASPTPAGGPAVSPSPSPSLPPISAPIVPSPTPSGILPFRVSFEPNFATIAAQGDMGTGTVFILDLTLTGGPGLKSVYVQFFEDGIWGPIPPQTASILLK